MMNIINGGAHADTGVDIQEFMVLPIGAESFSEALRWGVETYHSLKSLLKQKGLTTGLGDEGGFAPELENNRAALDLISEAIQNAGFTVGTDIALGLDVASSEFFENGVYRFEGKERSAAEMIGLLRRARRQLPAGLHRGPAGRGRLGGLGPPQRRARLEAAARRRRPVRHQPEASRPGHRREGGELHPRQGQPDRHAHRDARRRVALAQRNGMTAVLSHRSGETEDTTIADLAVATDAGQIKTGAPARSERVAKYNQLLRIEEELGDAARLRRPQRLPAFHGVASTRASLAKAPGCTSGGLRAARARAAWGLRCRRPIRPGHAEPGVERVSGPVVRVGDSEFASQVIEKIPAVEDHIGLVPEKTRAPVPAGAAGM